MYMYKPGMSLLFESYGVCRLEAKATIPSWAFEGSFFSVVKTHDEVSVVCEEKAIPIDVTCERNWRILKIEGPLDFGLVGILADLSSVLAAVEVSIFAISTYDTDYILLKDDRLMVGMTALEKSGYTIKRPSESV